MCSYLAKSCSNIVSIHLIDALMSNISHASQRKDDNPILFDEACENKGAMSMSLRAKRSIQSSMACKEHRIGSDVNLG